MLLYRQTYPTTALVLASDAFTLTFKRPSSVSASSSSPQIELSLEPISQFDVVGCTLLGKIYGSLGLVQLAKEIFLCVITGAEALTSRYNPEEQVYRIQTVDFFSVASTAWDEQAGHHGQDGGAVTASSTFGGSGDAYNLDQPLSSSSGAAGPQAQLFEHPASAMRKILSNSHFYFSSGAYDISTRLEERIRRRDDGDDATAYDNRFVWNGFLMDSILDFRENLSFQEKTLFDEAAFVVSAIQGYVGVHDFTLSGNPVTLSLISRLGFARAGTRFNTRGIDDDGNVANFVETESIFRTRDSVFSFVQIRGSVPLFWEQQGTTPFGGQRLQITRPAIASQPAFNKHFSSLMTSYPHIQAVNLLSSKDHEALLSNTYREHVRNANAQLGDKEHDLLSDKSNVHGSAEEIGYTEFDFHGKVRVAGGIESVKELIRRDAETGGKIENFGYCLAAVQGEKSVETLLSKQEGVFRTNCLDCLDRTNVVQDTLARLALEQYLRNLVPTWVNSDILLGAHRTLWAENGDALSKIYAGTGALNTSFTRSGKRTLAGALSDATKSVSRMYISNFVDKGKQLAIDALLGHLANQQKVVVVDPVRDSVESALSHRMSEYTSQTTYLVSCGTFNVNGKVQGNESLVPWLFPDPNIEPDIIALGFQELVELSPQQIMATDPEKLRRWQGYLKSAISDRPKAKSEYVMLRSEQLVGAAIILFTKTSIAQHVRNVEAASKKTGLKGIAGNKGAVAIRLELDDSSFCFVTAHFAAGHSNYEQRNMDYATIADGLHFRRGRKMVAHESILYFGDLNYRIQLPNDEARHMAQNDDYAGLMEGDQLTMCIKNQSVFAGYKEGPLLFRPTYKYDNNSDTYDSSEKQRVPSWTDRILYRGQGLELEMYNRAELKMSDHRPVFATFRADVRVVDHAKKESIAKELLLKLAPNKANGSISTASVLKGLLGEPDDLPEPSTDAASWWQTLNYASVAQASVRQRNKQVNNPFAKDFFLEPASNSNATVISKTDQSPSRGTSSNGATPSSNAVKRKAPPALPGNKPLLPSRTSSQTSLGLSPRQGTGFQSTLNRKASTASLLDEDESDSNAGTLPRPKTVREATTEWQVIAPSSSR